LLHGGDISNAMPIHSVQQAHDALVALMPPDAIHDNCSLCSPGRDSEQEEANVAEAAATPTIVGNQYSEAQHFSLLKSAVESETASLTAAKSELETRVETLESEKASAALELSQTKTQIDLLEADKSTAEAAAESARTELETFKTEIARKAQISELKNVRKSRVQTANEALDDDFFSDERITRWAEMSEEAFDAFVADMQEVAKVSKPVIASQTKSTGTEAARESAAFAGGTSPSETEGPSALSTILSAQRWATV
jgi:hypothetical protein